MNAFSKTVHPHGRGDNATTHRLRKTTSGSPPRAWGQSRGLRLRGRTSRFTPTGVGTMGSTMARASTRTVHPHGRGDNARAPGYPIRCVGSPPRAWGQSRRRAVWRAVPRFTPTGVGTMHTDYPPVAGRCGSPPRAWGQSRSVRSRIDALRFTPTGVGTMADDHGAVAPDAVHPHGRGDNLGR